MAKPNLESLVAAAVQNDRQAFTELYEISSSKSYFAALCITRNEKDAVNIMQSSYSLMHSRLERLKYPHMFENWFYRIVCKCIYDYIIKSNAVLFDTFNMMNVEDFNDELKIDDFSTDMLQFTQSDKITATKILEHLPADRRLCFLMYYYFKMSIEEISNVIPVDEKIIAVFLDEAKKIVKVNMIDELEKQDRSSDIPIIAFYNFALCSCSSHIPFTATDMIIGNIFKTEQSVPVSKPKMPAAPKPIPNSDSESTQMYSSEEMTQYLNQTHIPQQPQQSFNNQYKNQYKKEYSKGGAQDDAIPAAEPVSKIVKIVLAVLIALVFIVAIFAMVKNVAKNNESETTSAENITTEEVTTVAQYVQTTAPTTQAPTTTTTVTETTSVPETEPTTEAEEPSEEPVEPTGEVIE